MASPRVLSWTLAAASLIALPVTSQARVNIDVEIAPPLAVYQAPPPREGYIWVPSYWDWDTGRHEGECALPHGLRVDRMSLRMQETAF
jgi:hypothetical protein